MSQSLNKAMLIGRLGKDPEVRYTQSGKPVASFSLATDESYKNGEGEKVKKTEWHNIVVWGPSVEAFVEPYLHKGDMVYLEGKLQTRSWEDKKSGGTRYTTEINVSDIRGLVTVPVDEAKPAAKSKTKTASRPAQQQVDESEDAPEVRDEDIPF